MFYKNDEKKIYVRDKFYFLSRVKKKKKCEKHNGHAEKSFFLRSTINKITVSPESVYSYNRIMQGNKNCNKNNNCERRYSKTE